MEKISVWLVDKYFLPPPIPSKNRYKIFFDMPGIDLTVFSSYFSEYDKKTRQKLHLKNYRNANWIYVPSIRNSMPLFYISFAICFIIKSIIVLIRNPSRKPHIIIASCPDPFQALAALLVSKIAKVPLIIDFRDYWPELLVETGVMKPKSFRYRLLFFLTKILARFSSGIMAAERRYLTTYLKQRIGHLRKPIFIRENIYIEKDINERFKFNHENPVLKTILETIKKFKDENKYVLLITGRQNIKSEDTVVIHECLKKISPKVGVIALSNDQRIREISNSIVKYNMIDRESYLKVIDKVDAMLIFITDQTTEFSSNKMFDAISKGKPVLLGTRNIFEKKVPKIPGIIVFNIENNNSLHKAIEIMENIINDSNTKSQMINFCKHIYELQKINFKRFIRKVIENKPPGK